jgi:tetratricopeptide (TPR) repeat protein
MKYTGNRLTLAVIFVSIAFMACNDKKYMDEESDSSKFRIRTWDIAQSVLDNTTIMCETPALIEISADDIYIQVDSSWISQYPVEANTYLWQPDIFGNHKTVDDWYTCYQQVLYANAVLESIPQLPKSASKAQQDQVKGSALFYRCHAFLQLAIGFAGLYSPQTFNDPGIPLRKVTNPDTPSVRATVKETYDCITTDLIAATQLLPHDPDPFHKNRPSKPTVFALLARTYLFMGDYQQANLYADSCLQLYPVLNDYNNFDTTINPFILIKDEILYETNILSTADVLYKDKYYADSTLYSMYDDSDHRKDLYFTINGGGIPAFRYSKTGTQFRFSGIGVDEVYLTRAECYARTGQIRPAMDALTTLLRKRYVNGIYNPPPVTSASAALELILKERRKELPAQGLRWMDIRRLNRETPSITLKRVAEGKEYFLPAGDKKFILPIPPGVITGNPGMPQNPR